jgi:Transferase family
MEEIHQGKISISIKRRTLIKASNPPSSPPKAPISNLDLIFGHFQVALISIYPSSNSPFETIISIIQNKLPGFLNHFHPFAGRIKPDPVSNLPSLICDNSGAEFVVAESETTLSSIDFGDVDQSINIIQLPFAADIALSLQLVRFACGGFSVSWSTSHLLLDGHGLTALPTAWSDYLRTGTLLEFPKHERSIFVPRSPPRYNPSLNQEFTLYKPDALINVLSAASLLRKVYLVEAADVDRIRARASRGVKVTRLEAMSAYIWKLLATATGELDMSCRLAWIVDGRKRLGHKYKEATQGYLGNVLTYTSREERVDEIKKQSLVYGAGLARKAIEEVSCEERFEQLVDWMEVHKAAGKWTETVGVGLGAPTVVISSFLSFRIELDFGFGAPVMTFPWLRPGRLGSGTFAFLRSPRKDGSWIVSARLWPRLAEVIEQDVDKVFKPVTAEILGFVPARTSRL